MLVTVFCAPRDRPETTFALEVSPELELRDFVALCELESGIPAGEIQITYAEQPLKDPTRALGNYGVKDGEVVVLRQADRRPPPTQPAFPGLPHIDFRSISVPGTSNSNSQRNTVRPPQPTSPPQRSAQPSSPLALHGSSPQGLDDPALLQQMLLSNPHELSLLKERNPPLAEALLSGDLERFTKVLLEQQQDRAKREQERIRLLTADPFDLEAQAKIEEDIRQHNVEENMTIAMEEAPESFGQVVMLYINCKVNGHPVKAFVDSGAQMTIMSQACAERCNIMRLVDRRWAGIAKGVGTQKIIGRVHLAQVQIEGDFLPCSFSILEDQPMDMLLGLDMLKRHQCSIDLKKNVLLIGTTGTETRFLAEAELPECARLAYGAEGREDSRPEEMADRELAEALQRSIQESDTADGQTTSRLPPTQLPLLKTLDQMSSSCSGQSQSQPLDQSSLAPADALSATGQGQDLPGLLKPPGPNDAGPSSLQSHPTPLPDQSDLSVPPVTNPPTDALSTCAHPEDMSTGRSVDEEVQTGLTVTEDGLEGGVNSTTTLQLEQLPPAQPMEQESDVPDVCTLNQPDSVEMESSAAGETTVSSEREEPEVERRTRSDSIPSLAAALKELHQLIVSNKGTENRSASCSPPHPFRQEENETCPLGSQPEPSTAITQPTNAKANHAAAVSNEEPSKCVLPVLSGQEEQLDVNLVETLEEQRPKLCPDDSEVSKADECGQDVASNNSICQSEPEVSPNSAGDLELRELPEGQQGKRVKDEGASSNNSPKTLSPLSVEVGSAEETPAPSVPATAPQLIVGQYPAEHIQRIQAAGFSAQEAAEALEQAHGVVELALLALLARSITVPT